MALRTTSGILPFLAPGQEPSGGWGGRGLCLGLGDTFHRLIFIARYRQTGRIARRYAVARRCGSYVRAVPDVARLRWTCLAARKLLGWSLFRPSDDLGHRRRLSRSPGLSTSLRHAYAVHFPSLQPFKLPPKLPAASSPPSRCVRSGHFIPPCQGIFQSRLSYYPPHCVSNFINPQPLSDGSALLLRHDVQQAVRYE